jgi:hypothetical protein
MAEEAKQECKKNILGVLVKVVLGLALLALGIAAILAWKSDLLAVIKGCLGPFLLLAGIITLAIAKE